MTQQWTKPTTLRRAGAIAILLFFPYPLGLIAALGVPPGWPQGWPYVFGYAVWIAFVFLLDRVTLHGWPARLSIFAANKIRWPHLGVMYAAVSLFLVWQLLLRLRIVAPSPVLAWSANLPLLVGFLMEAATVVFEKTKPRPLSATEVA